MFKKIKFRELWNLEILSNKKISECIGKHNIMYSGTMHPTNSARDRTIISYIQITGDIKRDNSSFENLYKIIERNMGIYYKQKTDLSKEKFKIEIKEKNKYAEIILHGRKNYQFTILLETSKIIHSSDEFDNPLKDYGFEKGEPTKKLFSFKLEGNVNKNNESLHSLIAEINKEILKVIPNSTPLQMEFSVLKLKYIDRAIYFTIKAIEYPIILEFAINTV